MSVIATVRNEEQSIARFVEGIARQTRAPDQIVVVDGGSTDGTLARLREATAHDARWLIIERPGANISQGRNLAVGAATGSTIAVTDAGAVADERWLEHIIRPLDSPSVDVSAGFFAAGGESWFERCLGTIITPTLDEIDPRTFLPSSRSIAFRRAAFAATGGYPEWLSHCEDLVFDLELKHSGARFAFAPRAIVRWNARGSLRAFARQYFAYARGDGHAGLFLRRHVARYAAYLGLLAALTTRRRWIGLLLVVGYPLYATRYHRRVAATHPAMGAADWRRHAMVPVVLIVGDLSKMAGYPVGLLRRRTRGRT